MNAKTANAQAVKERPILFSAPMVRAILECRKTQTRRIIKHSEGIVDKVKGVTAVGVVPDRGEKPTHYELKFKNHKFNSGNPVVACRYGQPGDRLWVRESFCYQFSGGRMVDNKFYYAATHKGYLAKDDGDDGIAIRKDGTEASPWMPSIHMPRQASRILVEIIDVWAHKIQEISEEYAKAEGALPEVADFSETNFPYKLAFQRLWHTIHKSTGPDGWAANPWVWVISFKRIKP